MSVLRLAIIGGGHLGRIHAKLANQSEQFEVVGVADPSAEARALVKQQLQLPSVGDYHELIQQCDAAIVAAPTVAHYEVTTTLLRAGIHCLVEKPLASSPEEANRLVQIARHHNRVLQTGHVERFNPTWTAAQPQIGSPKYIESLRAGPYSGRSTDIGVVMDLMIHDLDLILSLDHTPVVDVQASGIALLGQHEDLAETRLRFASGCIATVRASRVSPSASRRMQVFSTYGYADIDFSADSVQVVRPTADVVCHAVALDEMSSDERMQAKQRIFDDYLEVEQLQAPGRNAILDEQNDFAISIQTGCSPAVSGADGARAVELATRIVDTVAQHQWDGADSRSWRIGAHASLEPSILPLPARPSDIAAPMPGRRAG